MAKLVSCPDRELGKAVCEAAGIDPKHIRRVEIIIEAGCATVVRFEFLAVGDQAPIEAMQTRLCNFKLVPLEA
jgi:hypothetical protein